MLDAEQTSQFDQTFNAIPGIMFAGTIYAVVQAIGNLVFLLLAYEGILFERFVTSDSLVEELVSVFGTICIGGVVSFFLLLVLSAVLAILMEIFNWTRRIKGYAAQSCFVFRGLPRSRRVCFSFSLVDA